MTSIASVATQLGAAVGPRAPGASAPQAFASGQDAVLAFARDPFRMLMVGLTIVNISRIHQQFGFIAVFRPALLLVLGAAAYAYMYPKALSRMKVLSYWPMRRVALLAILACFSVGFGISLGRAATFILDNYSKTILYCFLVALAIRGVKDLYTLMWSYVVSCGILSFLSLFVFRISSRGGGIARLTDLNTYDANDVCVVLVVGLAFVLLLLHTAKGSQRLVLFAVLIGIGGAIARSGSRGGFVGLVGFVVAAFFLLNSVSMVKKLATGIVLVVGLGMFAPAGYWEQMGTILSPKEDYNYTSLDGRKAVAERGLGYMMAYPIFGLGINNFSRAECTLANKRIGNGKLRCTAPHNSFVQAGAELGVPGLLVWSSLIFGGILAMLKLRRRLPRSWQRGNDVERFLYNATSYLALALAGFSAASFFVSFAWIDIIYFVMALMVGLYWSIELYQRQQADAAAPGGTPAPTTLTRVPGWRVARSAARMAHARLLQAPRPS